MWLLVGCVAGLLVRCFTVWWLIGFVYYCFVGCCGGYCLVGCCVRLGLGFGLLVWFGRVGGAGGCGVAVLGCWLIYD